MAVSGGQQASRGESDPSHSRPASSSNFLQFQWPLPLLSPPHPHLLLILPPFSLKEIGQKTWYISQKQPSSSTYTYCTPPPQIRLSSLLRCLVATSLDHSCNFTPVDWCAESGRDSYVFTPKFVYFQSEGPTPIRIHPLPRFVSCPSFLSPRAPLETGSKVWTHPRYCGWKVMSLSRFPFSRLRARTSMQEHIELGRDGMTILASILTHPSLKIAKYLLCSGVSRTQCSLLDSLCPLRRATALLH